MKVWHCHYYWSGAWGAYQTYDFICIAETKERALELAKTTADGVTTDQDWCVSEIDSTKESAVYINSRGS